MFDAYDGHVRGVGIAKDVDRWRVTDEWRFPTGGRLDVRPVVTDDSVYVAAPGEDEMTCLDIRTGEVRWTSKPGAKLLTPVIDNRRVIVASRDGQIVALDLRTGIELWRLATGLTYSSPPALSDDVVYVGGAERTLYAIKIG
jgi:outer membrane protein assembly factor BamB